MAPASVNIHRTERNVSAALGGALLLGSLARRSSIGTAVAAALLYRGLSGHSFLYQALGISTAGASEARGPGPSSDSVEVRRSVTVGKSPGELYNFWRDPRNLSQVMGDLAEVTAGSDDRAHWSMQGPFNRCIEWDAQVVEDRPGELLRWKSLDGALLRSEVAVRFRPAPRDWGTEVTLDIRLGLPGGRLASGAMKRMGMVSGLLVEKALRRFKSLIETGEMPTLKHNPSARQGAYAHSG